MRGKSFQPPLIIMKAGLIVIYEDIRSNVHCIDKAQALLHLASFDEFSDIGGYVDKGTSGLYVKGKIVGQGFHKNECPSLS